MPGALRFGGIHPEYFRYQSLGQKDKIVSAPEDLLQDLPCLYQCIFLSTFWTVAGPFFAFFTASSAPGTVDFAAGVALEMP